MTQGWVDRVIFQASSSGNGDFVVAAAVQGYNTPAQSLAVDGTLYHYSAQILDSGGNIIEWEVGTGAYTAGTTTLARTSVEFSSNGTSKVSFSAAPQVMITALAADFSATPVVPAIEPESGSSPIKISAFPNAATNMGSSDIVTGLQGGANANFSQAQILTGLNAPSVYSAYTGAAITVRGGNGAGGGQGGAALFYSGTGGLTGSGGILKFYAGNGGVTSGAGGNVRFKGGSGYGASGGKMFIYGGDSLGGNAGYVGLTGGTSTNGAYQGNGGNVTLYGGATSATSPVYRGGNVVLKGGGASGGATAGQVIILNLPVTDPAISQAVWVSNNVLVRSGIGNFSGTITTGSLVGKTITVVNGIITSFA